MNARRRDVPGSYKPNRLSRWERSFHTGLAAALAIYGLLGLLRGQFTVRPPRSRMGLVLFDRPAWLFAASLFVGAVVLLSHVVDHYDTRNNEIAYQLFRRWATALAGCLLLAAIVSGFYLDLVG